MDYCSVGTSVFFCEDRKEIDHEDGSLDGCPDAGSSQGGFPRFTFTISFDFDSAKRIFEEDPEEAERLRSELIEAFIDAHPESAEKLRQLQWRIDQVRAHYKNSPLGSCVVISRMLMEQVYEKGGFIYAVNALFIGFADQKEACALLEKEGAGGRLLPFKRT